MLKHFENHINKNLPFLKESKLLIAISGGIDSVILTHLCCKLGLNVTLAHCNFNLRGKESDADEAFVFKLAENLGLELFIERFNTNAYAKSNKRSIQMAARELRYHWFKQLAVQLKFNYVLTAHHADDNLETFLINFIRGTGIEGLTGIPEIKDEFVRPLLPFTSNDILDFAKSYNITWRDDSSNASTKYLRNKLRHEVVPILKDINPVLLQSFQNTLNHLKDTSSIVDNSKSCFLDKAIENQNANEVKFKISEFKKTNNPKAYLYEVFKNYGFTQWQDIVALLDAETGKQVFSKTHRLIKNRMHLLLCEITDNENDVYYISNTDKEIKMPLGTLYFNTVEGVSNKETAIIYIDKEKITYPLQLRKWQDGDVFFPLGMAGKKKLSKYFKDEKMSLIDKENTWLLCSENNIVWVINKRADNRFKVEKNTKNILKIEIR